MATVCVDKICEGTIDCNECPEMIPNICGGINIPTLHDVACGSIRFEGITDISVYLHDSVDLTQGVHAYDGEGNEISYTYSPSQIDTSVAGSYIVTYIAVGASRSIKPSMCGKNALVLTECENYGGAKAYREVNVGLADAVVCEAKICEAVVGCPPPVAAIACGARACESFATCS